MYYKVLVKCGHVGRKNCICIWMPVVAENKKEAARIARWLPRVKHHHPDAIRQVIVIDKKEYDILCEKNKKDPYLNCKNKQEQNKIEDLHTRIEVDDYNSSKIYKRKKVSLCPYKNRLVRNKKKFDKFNNYIAENAEEFDYVN